MAKQKEQSILDYVHTEEKPNKSEKTLLCLLNGLVFTTASSR